MKFTFSEALTGLKMGFDMRRDCWKKGYFITLDQKTNNIMAVDAELGTYEEWHIDHFQILAHDWCKYEITY